MLGFVQEGRAGCWSPTSTQDRGFLAPSGGWRFWERNDAKTQFGHFNGFDPAGQYFRKQTLGISPLNYIQRICYR